MISSRYNNNINIGISIFVSFPQLERGLAVSNLKNVVESTIHGSYAYQSLKTAAEITVTCLSEDQTRRPSIEDVLWNLQYAMQVQEGWNSSGNLSTQM